VSTGIRRRGQFLRTELLRAETEQTYSCALAPTSGSYPTLLFRRQERVRQHEARVYEVVVEDRVTDAETGRDGITYRALPGEEIRGETTTRETARDLGAFADAPFVVNGIAVQTDAAGLYVDTAQALLVPFDDLSVNALDVTVRHQELGTVSFRVTRYLTLRWQEKRPDERLRLVQTDLLVALGADFEPLTPAGHEGLRVSVSMPESVVCGQECVVRVEARNDGKRPVACLVARIFGRHAWLSGTTFYLGNIPAGTHRNFERVIHIPNGADLGPVFAAVGFWDILGPIREAVQPLSGTVVAGAIPGPAAPTPAAP